MYPQEIVIDSPRRGDWERTAVQRFRALNGFLQKNPGATLGEIGSFYTSKRFGGLVWGKENALEDLQALRVAGLVLKVNLPGKEPGWFNQSDKRKVVQLLNEQVKGLNG